MRFIKDDECSQEPHDEFCCSVNASGDILFTTPAMTSYLLYTREDLEQRHFTELLHPQDRPIVSSKLDGLSAGQQYLEFSARCLSGNGVYTAFDWSIARCGGIFTARAKLSDS